MRSNRPARANHRADCAKTHRLRAVRRLSAAGPGRPGRRSAPPTRKPRPRCTSWAPWPPNPWSPPGTRAAHAGGLHLLGRWRRPGRHDRGARRPRCGARQRPWRNARLAAPRDAGTRRTCSVCTGAFLLASAGLLDGRVVTTHWRSADRLRQLYPALRVEDDRLYVDSGKYWTSAGVSAGIDLALALIERDHGPELSQQVARRLVVFMARRRPAPVQPDPAAAGPRRRAVPRAGAEDGGATVGPLVDRRHGRRLRHVAPHLQRKFIAHFGVAPTEVLRMLRRKRAGAVQASGKMSKKEMERHLGPWASPGRPRRRQAPGWPVRGRAGLMRPVALLPCGIQQTFRD